MDEELIVSDEDDLARTLWELMENGLRRATLVQPTRPDQTLWHRDCVAIHPSFRFQASVRLSADDVPRYVYNFGSALALLDACLALVADPGFLPEIPFDPASNYQGGPGAYRERFVDYMSSTEGETLLPIPDVTEEDQRLNLSDHLFGMGLYFLALHEQGHFFLGHALYARQNSRLEAGEAWPEIEAASSQAVGILPASLHRSFELQADRFAFDQLLRMGSRLANDRAEDPEGFEEIDSLEDWLVFAALGGLIVCGIFEINDRIVQIVPEQQRHPSAAARTFVLMQSLRDAMLEFVADAEMADAILAHVITNAQRLYAVLGVSPLAEQAMQAWLMQLEVEYPALVEGQEPLSVLAEYQEALAVQETWRETLLPFEQAAYRKFGLERNER